MQLPVNDQPLLGKHITLLLELFKSKTSTVWSWRNDTVAATGTTYFAPWTGSDGTVEKDCQVLLPRAGVIKNLAVRHLTAGSVSDRLVYTVQLNGLATALEVSLPGKSTACVHHNISIPFRQDDLLSVRITRPDGSVATAPGDILLSFEVQ